VAITQSLPEREAIAPVQLSLKGDEERVYLVGVEIRERKKAKSVFTGAPCSSCSCSHYLPQALACSLVHQRKINNTSSNAVGAET
jgi:hypothetical protein